MDSKTVKHIKDVFAYLNQSSCYAVLRNYEQLPHNLNSRDIDIVIAPQSYHRMKKGLVDLIGNSGWKIMIYYQSDRLITLVTSFAQGGKAELVQWDFFMHTSVFGIMLMDADSFLKNRHFNGFLYYVDKEKQFLDKYLYNRSVGKQYPIRYAAIRQEMGLNEGVNAQLKQTFGVSSVAACDKMGGRKLLRHAAKQDALHHPLGMLWRMMSFIFYYIKNYFGSHAGFSIGFTGTDGSGKTTVIQLLENALYPVFGKMSRYYHFRPHLFANLGEVAHYTGLKSSVDRDYERPHRATKTGIISSFLRLCYYATDYFLGYFFTIKKAVRITQLAIFDRYYADIVCDGRRSRICLNYKFLYLFGRCFIPNLDYNILLTASVETILNRKEELSCDAIVAIQQRMAYLSTKPNYILIHNDGTPMEAVQEVLSTVCDHQHYKNLKRLC